MSDQTEAAGFVKSIQTIFVRGGEASQTFETSEGEFKFHQIADTFASMMPVKDSYYSPKTGRRNEVNGIGIHLVESAEELEAKVVKLIRRMRRVNKIRAEYNQG